MRLRDIDEIDALTALLVGEAGGEDIVGKMAVADVVRNRLIDHRWPNTWKGVIFQRKQFSCMNSIPRNGQTDSGYFTHAWDDFWWKECRLAAFGIMYNCIEDITGGANHYYAYKLMPEPYWATGHESNITIGGHKFYTL